MSCMAECKVTVLPRLSIRMHKQPAVGVYMQFFHLKVLDTRQR